jgi:hypothetical protein
MTNTPEQNAIQELRRKRDELLAETDWMVIKAQESGVPISQEWKNYRQALRDLPSTTNIVVHPKYENLDWRQIQMPVKPE